MSCLLLINLSSVFLKLVRKLSLLPLMDLCMLMTDYHEFSMPVIHQKIPNLNKSPEPVEKQVLLFPARFMQWTFWAAVYLIMSALLFFPHSRLCYFKLSLLYFEIIHFKYLWIFVHLHHPVKLPTCNDSSQVNSSGLAFHYFAFCTAAPLLSSLLHQEAKIWRN